MWRVLIPLRIRSISTKVKAEKTKAALTDGLNPFENQVYFYTTGYFRKRSLFYIGLNPFENQVYFYRCPPEAAPGAGLRACLREPRRCEPVLSEIKIVIAGILLKLKGICSARPFYERLLNV